MSRVSAEEITRQGAVVRSPRHGLIWAKSILNLGNWREEIIVIPEDGPPIFASLTLDALYERTTFPTIYTAIRGMMDQTLKPVIMDSEGGWGSEFSGWRD